MTVQLPGAFALGVFVGQVGFWIGFRLGHMRRCPHCGQGS